MLMKIIDLYIGVAGLVGLMMALGVIAYTFYQLVTRRNYTSLLIFLGIGLLLFIKTTNRIFALGAIGIVFIALSFYFYFVMRCFFVKPKPTKKVMTDYPRVSVVIPARNEGKVIRDTLLSVSQMDYPQSKFDIIVIDDGSTDDTRAIVSALKEIQNLKIISHPTSQGKSKGLNQVIREITSEYVLILDADHLIDKDFLKKALLGFDSPDIVCVQGKCAVRNGKASLLTRLVELDFEVRYRIIMKGRNLPFFMGSAGLFKTELLRKQGGFDPVMLTEDYEFSHRVYLEGYRIVYDPEIKTYELATVDLKNFFVQRHRWFRGICQLLYHHFKDIVTTKKLSLGGKAVISSYHFEGLALTPYLFVNILCALDLLQLIHFEYKYYFFVQALSLVLLHSLAITAYKKPALYIFLPFIPFYYVLFAVPNFMAFIDNLILKSEYKWNKTDRSVMKGMGQVIGREEIAAGEYNEM